MAWRVRPRPRHGGWSFTFQGKTYWKKLEADAWHKLHELQQLAGVADEDHAPRTVLGLIDRWQAQHPNSHAAQRLADLDEFAGERPLRDLPPDFLNEYHVWLTEVRRSRRQGPRNGHSLSAETVRKDVRYAASVLRWGADRGWVKPMQQKPRLSRPVARPKAPSRIELATFWRSMRREKRCHAALPLTRFIAKTGCRPGEARLLEWSEVDLKRRVVTIGEHKTTHATGELRVFGLSASAARLVARQRGRHPTSVFVSARRQPYTKDGFAVILRRHGLTPYRLRHNWCQHATEAGVSDSVILRQMGHVSSRMLAMYRRITDAQLVAASGQLDGLARVRLPPAPQV